MPTVASRVLWPVLAALVFLISGSSVDAGDEEQLIPKQFSKEQRGRIEQFLKDHAKPDRFIPADAKLVGTAPRGGEPAAEVKPGQAIKQFLVQINAHRPVPGQEQVNRVDVYYYRPNPEKGKPGVTVKHTLDVTTGKEIGQTEVLLNGRTPLAREELAEAVELAKEKSESVQALYKQFDKSAVHWEYLQLSINRKQDTLEPGDRAVLLTFRVTVPKDQAEPTPVRAIVNVTKGEVTPGPK
jgi:hypothetical protein